MDGIVAMRAGDEMDFAKYLRQAVRRLPEKLPVIGDQTATSSLCGPLVTAIFGFGLLLASGCATTQPYVYGKFHPDRPTDTDVTEVAIEYGRPNKTLDRIGNILATPAKLVSLNSKIDNHHVSEETIEKLVTYMEKNDITDVYVSVNDYSPKTQWRRMRENDRIAPGWKYTAGTLSWVGYTVSPGRLFGGTSYNPYTNTLYINSDVPAIALAEAAYAKDIHARQFPGTYAVFANGLPVVSIWRQSRAIGDVLGYARAEQDWSIEKETYRVKYPQIGASTFGGMGMFITGSPVSLTSMIISPVLGAGGAAAGHAAGRTMTKRREAELKHDASCNELLTNAEPPKPSSDKPDDIDIELGGQPEDDAAKPLVQASYDDNDDDEN